MASKKGQFVYSSNGGGSIGRGSAPVLSQRKRKRSTSPPDGGGVFTSNIDTNGSDDDTDDIDIEGLMALEQYEQSQRDPNAMGPPEINNTRPAPLISHSQPLNLASSFPIHKDTPRLATPAQTHQPLNITRPSHPLNITMPRPPTRPLANITGPTANITKPPANITRPSAASGTFNSTKLDPPALLTLQNRQGYPYESSYNHPSSSSQVLPAAAASDGKGETSNNDKILAMDGEIKILRQKLHDRDQEYYNMLNTRSAEKRAQEQEQKKEMESLKANLAFKDQEITELKEKLEQVKQQKKVVRTLEPESKSTESKSVSTIGSVKHDHMEFESTETFIPSSQVSHSKVVPVTSGKRRRSHSTSHTLLPKTGMTEISRIDKGSQTGMDIRCLAQALSPPDMSGPQLVRLLLQRNLLTIPDIKALEKQVNDLDIQEKEKETFQPLGLLSLLPGSTHLSYSPSSSSSSSLSQSSSLLITPVNRQCIIETGGQKTTPLLSPLQPPCKRPLIHFPSIESLDSDTSYSKISTPQNFVPPHPPPPSLSNPVLSIQDSLASLLSSADRPGSSAPSSFSFSRDKKMPHYSLETFGKYPQSLSSCDTGVSLLPSFESVLESYLEEQVQRRRKKKASNDGRSSPSFPGGTVFIDSSSGASQSNPSSSNEEPAAPFSDSYTVTGQTSSEVSESSQSSASTSDKVFKKAQALEVALALEILCKYSRQVREVLLLKKPHFSRSGLLESDCKIPYHLASDDSDSDSADELETGESKNQNTPKATGIPQDTSREAFPTPPAGMIPLADFLGGIVSKNVFINKEQIDSSFKQTYLTPGDSAILQGRAPIYTGNLFDVLLGLVSNMFWEENVELLCSILETLTVIASDCPVESLERYAVLLKKDSVLVSLLLLEIPEVTLKVVNLALPLTRSADLTQLFCSNSNMCPLDHFYALYVPRAIIESIKLKTKIELQLTRMLSALASTPEGEKVLYESGCCSYQFLKSLASSLLHALADMKSDELQEDRINREHRRLCAMEMVRLVHLVCSSDRFIDEHKNECYHTFIGSLTKGHEAFKGTNVEDLLLDLLEYEGVAEEDFS